jgi:uncharacterized protein involved in tolerance to divalent cations
LADGLTCADVLTERSIFWWDGNIIDGDRIISLARRYGVHFVAAIGKLPPTYGLDVTITLSKYKIYLPFAPA